MRCARCRGRARSDAAAGRGQTFAVRRARGRPKAARARSLGLPTTRRRARCRVASPPCSLRAAAQRAQPLALVSEALVRGASRRGARSARLASARRVLTRAGRPPRGSRDRAPQILARHGPGPRAREKHPQRTNAPRAVAIPPGEDKSSFAASDACDSPSYTLLGRKGPYLRLGRVTRHVTPGRLARAVAGGRRRAVCVDICKSLAVVRRHLRSNRTGCWARGARVRPCKALARGPHARPSCRVCRTCLLVPCLVSGAWASEGAQSPRKYFRPILPRQRPRTSSHAVVLRVSLDTRPINKYAYCPQHARGGARDKTGHLKRAARLAGSLSQNARRSTCARAFEVGGRLSQRRSTRSATSTPSLHMPH